MRLRRPTRAWLLLKLHVLLCCWLLLKLRLAIDTPSIITPASVNGRVEGGRLGSRGGGSGCSGYVRRLLAAPLASS